MTELFQRIKAQGVNVINELIETGAQEGLQLDFKASNGESGNPLFTDSGKVLSKEAKKVLAKELSSFANSTGGAIILGVICKLDPESKVDCATGSSCIADLAACVSTLDRTIPSLVQPVITNLEVLSVEEKAGSNEGYIAISVPRSNRRPHRSEATDQKQYFKRSVATSFVMEHYEIEDAFRSVVSPELDIRFKLHQAVRTGNSFKIECTTIAKNVGGAAAKNICLRFGKKFQSKISSGGHTRSQSQLERTDSDTTIILPTAFVILPGIERAIDTFHISIGPDSNGKLQIHGYDPTDAYYEVVGEVSCENMRPTEFRHEILSSELYRTAGI